MPSKTGSLSSSAGVGLQVTKSRKGLNGKRPAFFIKSKDCKALYTTFTHSYTHPHKE